MWLLRVVMLWMLGLLSASHLYAQTEQQCDAVAVNPTKININTATAEQLATGLKGIGKAKANAIIEWRQTNGNFQSLEDLDEVKGIGAGLLDKNKEIVIFRDE